VLEATEKPLPSWPSLAVWESCEVPRTPQGTARETRPRNAVRQPRLTLHHFTQVMEAAGPRRSAPIPSRWRRGRLGSDGNGDEKQRAWARCPPVGPVAAGVGAPLSSLCHEKGPGVCMIHLGTL
jgi:hypothetical protein